MATVRMWRPFARGTSTSRLVEVLSDDPGRWLPAPADGRGVGQWAVTLRAGPVARTATCSVSAPEGGDDGVVRLLRWKADPEPSDDPEKWQRALPSFDGALLLRSRDGEWPELRLEGEWTSPRGTIGAALAPSALQILAERSAERFLTDVIDNLLQHVTRRSSE